METNNESKFNRFKSAPWFTPDNREKVLVGGAGGIGSWASFFLSRAGFEPVIYDFDTIEEHNLGGQLFSKKQIGKPKVEAIHDIILEFCDEDISYFNSRVSPGEIITTHSFIFSAFDSIQARKILFEKWVKMKKNMFPIFIDGRLSMEFFQIYCVTEDTIDKYRKTLIPDDEIEEEVCTLKQTSHTAAMIATKMVSFFTNHISNINTRNNSRIVPFKYEHFVPVLFDKYSIVTRKNN